ncbi:MAG: methionyl-tRNA formyltransferase [Woeseia sp.]
MPDNLVFAGTPGFALASLEALVDSGWPPALVLTRPDRRAGRGQRLSAGPVKSYALAQGIPLRQPASLQDPAVRAELAELQPAAIIVAAYGLLFPPDLLDLPERGCINVHASLLPRWRGAAPVQAAILNGDAETGISLMQMETGLDTGPVLASKSLLIGETETAGLLQNRLAALGGKLLQQNLPAILSGELRPLPQQDSRATYAKKVTTADARLDWRRSATQLLRCVRAYDPEPGAWFMLRGERMKCRAAQALDPCRDAGTCPGSVLAANREGIDVACGEGVIRLLRLQRPGRKPVSAFEFASQQSLTGELLPV